MLNLSAQLAKQLRRPQGFIGRHLMTRLLDRGNREIIVATLARLQLDPGSRYLDLGFGGGSALKLAAKTVTNAPLVGVDFSPDVVRQGRRRLHTLIAAHRLTLLQGDICDLPLPSESADCVSTINTIYFWPDPARGASEIWRVLAPGGCVAIGYTGAEKMAGYSHFTQGFKHYRAPEVETLLLAAGFVDVKTDELKQGITRGDFVTVGKRAAV